MVHEALADLLARYPEIISAYLFGSLAKGSARPDSDVDVAIETCVPMPSERKIQLIGDIATITGRAVDLVDLRQAGEPLLGQVLQHGIQLKGTNTTHAELLRRHLFDSEDFLPYVRRILAQRRQKWTD